MLGLHRQKVQLIPHQANWATIFAAEKAVLQHHLSRYFIDIQHVGSTSVPDLWAKPIIDIAAAVQSAEIFPTLSPKLCDLNWLDRGDQGKDGGYLWVKESQPDVRFIHLHVVAIDDPQWRQYIGFRDVLRQFTETRKAYQMLKQNLAQKYINERQQYTINKASFVQNILDQYHFKEFL